MDQFMTMRAFVEAVKKRSLTNAAHTLGASRALVSRQIQGLEERLGVRLMHRTTRSIALTDAGEKYFHFCDNILAQIADMEKEISDEMSAPEGTLAILSPKWIGSHAAADAVAAFARKYPAIKPKMILGGMSPTAYDFLEQGCDVALHTRPLPDSRILARRVTTIPMVLCATPEYLETAPPLKTPRDIPEHKGLIQYNYPGWRFEKDGKSEKVIVQNVFSANTYLTLHRAALASLGLVLLPLSIAKPDLDSGVLVQVLPDWDLESQSLYVAIAPGGGTPAKVRLFVDFISEWFKGNPL